jgi:cytochrome c oxidase subunit IV
MTGHLVPRKVYYTVFGALLVLTAVTIAVASVDLGPLNTVVAMTIACAKATLVVLYFMHARYGSRLIWVMLGAGILWLAILIALTMGDYASRGWMPS